MNISNKNSYETIEEANEKEILINTKHQAIKRINFIIDELKIECNELEEYRFVEKLILKLKDRKLSMLKNISFLLIGDQNGE